MPLKAPLASTEAYTTSVSAGEMERPIRPRSPGGNPERVRDQVLPPSSVRKMTPPYPTARPVVASRNATPESGVKRMIRRPDLDLFR